jgi:hypothetical protein
MHIRCREEETGNRKEYWDYRNPELSEGMPF